MKVKKFILIIGFILFGLFQVSAQQKFGNTKYVTYSDTGYVFLPSLTFYVILLAVEKNIRSGPCSN